MTFSTKMIARHLHGQTIVGAPHSCANPTEFMAGAKEQQENAIDAVATALFGHADTAEKTEFKRLCICDFSDI